MKKYTNYSELPSHAIYLGSEYPDGTMDESLADDIDFAINPVCLNEDGTNHYFDCRRDI